MSSLASLFPRSKVLLPLALTSSLKTDLKDELFQVLYAYLLSLGQTSCLILPELVCPKAFL